MDTERRRRARCKLRWPVYAVTAAGLIQGVTEDMSLSGLSMRCTKGIEAVRQLTTRISFIHFGVRNMDDLGIGCAKEVPFCSYLPTSKSFFCRDSSCQTASITHFLGAKTGISRDLRIEQSNASHDPAPTQLGRTPHR